MSATPILADYLHLTWKKIPRDVVEALAKQRLNDTLAACGHEPVLDSHWQEVRHRWIQRVNKRHTYMRGLDDKLSKAVNRRNVSLGHADESQRKRTQKLMRIKGMEDAL